MPKLYEQVRDFYIKKGLSTKKAKQRAAMWWNKTHPSNTNPWVGEKTRKRR